jgi:hypothetical protein
MQLLKGSVAGLPRDAADVRAGDAQIGEIAIGAQSQFIQVLTILAPLLDMVAKAHLVFPLFLTNLLGKIVRRVRHENCQCCMAAMSMLHSNMTGNPNPLLNFQQAAL